MSIIKQLFSWLTGQQFIMYGMGGGGGSPAPSSSTVTNTNIPEYAQPYVETMLGAAQQQIFNYAPSTGSSTAQYRDVPVYGPSTVNGGRDPNYGKQIQTGTQKELIPGTGGAGDMIPTSIKQYQPFSTNMNDYVAGFSPMQQQGFSNIANMGAGVQDYQNQVGGYMSPYIQNAVAAQEREAARQSDIQGQGQQAQAAQAGAFGGARDALQRSERERNLANVQSDIAAQGFQNAFNSAQNQYNTGFGQQTGLAQLQNQFGGQQQQLEQSKINQQIQNYATQQQYPMMQLANMSNLLRGLPMQASTTQGYQAAPNPMSQLGGLGLTTAGIAGKLGAKKGGAVKDIKKRPAGLAELALSKMQ